MRGHTRRRKDRQAATAQQMSAFIGASTPTLWRLQHWKRSPAYAKRCPQFPQRSLCLHLRKGCLIIPLVSLVVFGSPYPQTMSFGLSNPPETLPSRAADPRVQNCRTLLRLIWEHSLCSRTDLVRYSGWSASAVAPAVTVLSPLVCTSALSTQSQLVGNIGRSLSAIETKFVC